MKETRRQCLYCDKPIRSGRSDKKFCDAGCKDAYYNAIKVNEHDEIKKIDILLKRNRRILKKLFRPKSDKRIAKSTLLKEGFSFEFHTHHLITKAKGNQFIFCYDFGYREVADDQIQIIKAF